MIVAGRLKNPGKWKNPVNSNQNISGYCWSIKHFYKVQAFNSVTEPLSMDGNFGFGDLWWKNMWQRSCDGMKPDLFWFVKFLTSTDGAGGLEKDTVNFVASLETALNVIPEKKKKTKLSPLVLFFLK